MSDWCLLVLVGGVVGILVDSAVWWRKVRRLEARLNAAEAKANLPRTTKTYPRGFKGDGF